MQWSQWDWNQQRLDVAWGAPARRRRLTAKP